MNIKYDIERIKRIISDFANITGLSIALLDTDFQYLATYSYNESAFCRSIQQYEQGRHRCRHSDRDMLEQCRECKGFVSHVCHAGIIDSCMPLMKDMMITGYIILGRIRPSDDFQDVAQRVCWMQGKEKELAESYQKITYYDQGQIQSLSNLLTDSLFASAITVELDQMLKTVTDYIEDHLDSELTVSALCRVGHMSKNMLYKKFQDTFGCTINEYITAMRIQKAKILLESTNKPIQEIGELAGMEHPAHFCRTFKKLTGMAPTVYRKMCMRPGVDD